MKPNESYLAMNTRLERPGFNEAAAKIDVETAGVEKSTDAGTNAKAARNLSTARPAFDAQKVADIKLQFASGNYHVDTDALAAKMLDAGVLDAHATC